MGWCITELFGIMNVSGKIADGLPDVADITTLQVYTQKHYTYGTIQSHTYITSHTT